MSNPVSVVVPTYNGAEFVERALRSVFAQTCLPGEIVVVDDCSSDKTLALAASLSRSAPLPVRIIRLSKNSGGPGRPLNTGVAAAAGEIIALLEQDDLMRPCRINKQLAAAQRFPECSMITGRSTVHGNADGDMRPVWPIPQFDGVVDDIDSRPDIFTLNQGPAFRGLLQRQIMGGHSTFCFTKRSWRQIGGFNEKLRVCVDVDFALRAVLMGPVVVVKDFITDYGYRPDSLCRQDHDAAMIEVTLVRLKFASTRRDLAGEELRALQAASRALAKAAMQRGRWAIMARLLVPLFRYGGIVSAARSRSRQYFRRRLT